MIRMQCPGDAQQQSVRMYAGWIGPAQSILEQWLTPCSLVPARRARVYSAGALLDFTARPQVGLCRLA